MMSCYVASWNATPFYDTSCKIGSGKDERDETN